MTAYKCDLCGKYFDDVYRFPEEIFDIFPSETEEMGLPKERIKIRDMCRDCYSNIKCFIVDEYIKNKIMNRRSEEANKDGNK